MAGTAAFVALTVIMSRVTDFIPDSIELPMLVLGGAVVAVLIAVWIRTRT